MWPCHKQRNCMSCTNGAQSWHTQYWEQLLCVAIHHHFHRTTYCTSRYELLAMQDLKISMHGVASPSPAFGTDDGDDGSSPCHFVLVSHHSLHDNPRFYSPRSQSYLSKTKHIQSNAWRRKDRKMEMSRWSGRRASPLPRNTQERNLKFQPPHTGNRRPVSRANQSERRIEILGVVCGVKGVVCGAKSVVLRSLLLLGEKNSGNLCVFHLSGPA